MAVKGVHNFGWHVRGRYSFELLYIGLFSRKYSVVRFLTSPETFAVITCFFYETVNLLALWLLKQPKRPYLEYKIFFFIAEIFL
jgi:hypothetical protein